MNTELISGNVKSVMSQSNATSRDLWQVPIEKLHVIDGFNVRTDGAEHKQHVIGITESILANGFYQSKPLSGYVALEGSKQVIYITDGHFRLEAAKEAVKRGAEIKSLPIVIAPKGTNIEDLTVGLVTNNSGKPLSQYEIGLVCKRLIGFGWDAKDIARRLGMAVQRVGDLLTLVAAPAAVRKLVAAGTVSATQAIDTLRRHGDKAAEKLEAGAEKAAKSGKKKATRKQIESAPTHRAVVKALLAWAAHHQAIVKDNQKLSDIIDMARETQS